MSQNTIEITLNLFSGSPNPSWRLSPSRLEGLKKKLEDLVPTDRPFREPPGLGYGGIIVRATEDVSSEQEWHLYGGRVLHEGKVYLDPNRVLERLLIKSGQDVLDSEILKIISDNLENSR